MTDIPTALLEGMREINLSQSWKLVGGVGLWKESLLTPPSHLPKDMKRL